MKTLLRVALVLLVGAVVNADEPQMIPFDQAVQICKAQISLSVVDGSLLALDELETVLKQQPKDMVFTRDGLIEAIRVLKASLKKYPKPEGAAK